MTHKNKICCRSPEPPTGQLTRVNTPRNHIHVSYHVTMGMLRLCSIKKVITPVCLCHPLLVSIVHPEGTTIMNPHVAQPQQHLVSSH